MKPKVMDWEYWSTVGTYATGILLVVTFIVSLGALVANHKAGQIKDLRVTTLQNRLEPYPRLTQDQKETFHRLIGEKTEAKIAVSASQAPFDTMPLATEIDQLFKEIGYGTVGVSKLNTDPPVLGVRIIVSNPDYETFQRIRKALSAIGFEPTIVIEDGHSHEFIHIIVGGKS